MGRRKPSRDLVDDSDDGVERKRRLAQEPLRQALAGEVLHDQVLGPVRGRVVIDDLDDVGVLQQRGDARLPVEQRDRLRAHRRLQQQELDGVATGETGMGGLVDRAHRALPEQARQTIGVVEQLALAEQGRGGWEPGSATRSVAAGGSSVVFKTFHAV